MSANITIHTGYGNSFDLEIREGLLWKIAGVTLKYKGKSFGFVNFAIGRKLHAHLTPGRLIANIQADPSKYVNGSYRMVFLPIEEYVHYARLNGTRKISYFNELSAQGIPKMSHEIIGIDLNGQRFERIHTTRNSATAAK